MSSPGSFSNRPETPRSSPLPARLHPLQIDEAVRAALNEDLGLAGDITSQATLGPDRSATASFNLRQPAIVCGMDVAKSAFAQIGPGLDFSPLATDGDHLPEKTCIARVTGNARKIFAAERVALNFLSHMSGVATATGAFVAEINGTGAAICCTRKTTPGLRAFEKYAVRCGGGINHRYGLSDAILIKDNHVAVAGGVAEALAAARAFAGHLVAIEIEVDTIDQFVIALEAGARIVLLDNMSPGELVEAVRINKGRARLEASGGVSLDTVRAIAETGVDYISTSRITMAATPVDIGLDIEMNSQNLEMNG
jgi:nicotinate-nucleotide pyrophosphorylase (carboxylating)